MDGVSVSKLSRDIGVPVELLMNHLNQIGCKVTNERDLVTGRQQLLLLEHLRKIESRSRRKNSVTLSDLENASTLLELNDLLTQAMTRQQIQALIKGRNLDVVVNLTLALYRRGEQELLVAAMLARLAAVARGDRAQTVLTRVRDVLTDEPPSIETLEDGDTKAYAATALSQVDKPWLLPYSIREALLIDSADNARRQLLLATLHRQGSIANWISPITSQAALLQQLPPTTRQRRIRRIFGIMRFVAQRWQGDIGSDVGAQLSTCLYAFLSPMNLADLDEEVLFPATDHLMSILTRVIELRYSTALHAETYEIIGQGKRTFGAGLWGRFMRASNSLPVVRRSLLESALVLARQNRTDKQISTTIVSTYTSHPQACRAVSKHLEIAHDLDPEVKRWWSNLGKVTGSKRPVEQKFGNSEDSLIGSLLIAVDRNRDTMEKVGRAVVPLLEISDEVLALTVNKGVKRFRDIDQTARRLARMRKLSKTDEVGKRVDYNPLKYELVGGHRPGVRWVKVIRDGVQKDFGGKVKTLVKPWVEIDDGNSL